MPRLLILVLFIFTCTLVGPAIVWAISGRWREAVRAWWQFSVYLLGLSALGIITALGYWIWPPVV